MLMIFGRLRKCDDVLKFSNGFTTGISASYFMRVKT